MDDCSSMPIRINQAGRSPGTLTSAAIVPTESVALPEFGTLPTLRVLFSIPRSTAYELEKAGEISFVRLRKRGQIRGKVLVDFASVRGYLKRCEEGQ